MPKISYYSWANLSARERETDKGRGRDTKRRRQWHPTPMFLSLSLSPLSQPKIWVQILILCLGQWILKQFLKLQMALLKIQDIDNNVSSLQSTHVSNAYFYYKTNPKVQATPDQLSALKTKTES